MRTIAVVGMSLAGLRAVETLRRDGFDGRIVAIGAEPHLPYDRPPLSKELLAGSVEPEHILLRPQGFDDLDLDWRLEARAVALDVRAREVELHDGERVAFDGLVIATGSCARRLPGQPPLAGLFTLRTLDDALALREVLHGRPRVVVIGAGFIGAEVAATCRRRGLDVTVLEALPQPMVRGLGPALGEVLARVHRDHGVDLRTNVVVDAIEGDGGAVTGVRLGDGTVIDADVVLVGIGAQPETSWLEGSGLALDDGVVCDATGLVAPGIVAAGDVANWPNPLFDGRRMRLEHWTNAVEMGVHVASRLLAGDRGADRVFAPVPFVWSDQYDRKIQVVGHLAEATDVHVCHGTLDEYRFVALFGRHGRLVGALGFNRPRQVMQYRRMIAERATFADAVAAAGAGAP
ncbi:MAG: pyridine nucleotide-disulfide oxidoreductase [Acidimicrobiia bacterium]|nr:MAG: pyridine nucleotide-disulfide oxidoreductase [Acidimicrobiia bacterium]